MPARPSDAMHLRRLDVCIAQHAKQLHKPGQNFHNSTSRSAIKCAGLLRHMGFVAAVFRLHAPAIRIYADIRMAVVSTTRSRCGMKCACVCYRFVCTLANTILIGWRAHVNNTKKRTIVTIIAGEHHQIVRFECALATIASAIRKSTAPTVIYYFLFIRRPENKHT